MGEDGASFVCETGNVRNKDDILIGWKLDNKNQFGFSGQIQTEHKGRAIYTDGKGHSCTVAATGRGKTVALISRLLRCPTSAIILDVKGEIYHVTQRYRKEVMGHEILLFDPTHHIKNTGKVKRSSFNPLDVYKVIGGDLEDFITDILSIIYNPNERSNKEPYWDNVSFNYAYGLLLDLMLVGKPKRRNLVVLWQRMFGEAYDSAVIADAAEAKKDEIPLLQKAISLIGSVLTLPDLTKGGVISTGQHHFSWLTSNALEEFLEQTSFDLEAIYKGKPFTMYIVIPPYKLYKLLPMIRLLLHVLALMLFQRPKPRDNPVRLIIDEAGVIGQLDILQSLISLGRGYSLYLDLIFQDLSQMKAAYEKNWQNLLGNMSYQQYFGFNDFETAQEICKRTGFSPEYLMEMNRNKDLMLFVENGIGEVVKKVNYLRDTKEFEGRYDPNPFYL